MYTLPVQSRLYSWASISNGSCCTTISAALGPLPAVFSSSSCIQQATADVKKCPHHESSHLNAHQARTKASPCLCWAHGPSFVAMVCDVAFSLRTHVRRWDTNRVTAVNGNVLEPQLLGRFRAATPESKSNWPLLVIPRLLHKQSE